MSIPNFSSVPEFVEYLDNTLIPDLRESGSDATADDFEEAVYWLLFMGGRLAAISNSQTSKRN